MINKQAAINWWNTLTLREQINRTNEYFLERDGNTRELHTLNSDEIKELYNEKLEEEVEELLMCSNCGAIGHHTFDCPKENIILDYNQQ